jgi:hypothetical protein
MKTSGTVLPLLCAVLGIGCTHTQLRYNTVHQALTVSDIHQKQVLNNLAKFVHDPHALPDFAFVTAGASGVMDSGNLGFDVLWFWNGGGENSIGGGAERAVDESWVLNPVADPRRLELMRCAFQRAVSACCQNAESVSCPNCTKRFNEFYTGRPYASDVKGRALLDETGSVASIVTPPWEDADSGIVNSECLHAPCWFHVGRKEHLPANHDCIPWGHYCGVYVWVVPGHGTDELSKLTLAILDYAINQPPSPPAKEVKVEYNVVGGVTRIPVRITEKFRTTAGDYLAPLKHDGESPDERPRALPRNEDRGTLFVPETPIPNPTPTPRTLDILQFDQKLQTLTPFSR